MGRRLVADDEPTGHFYLHWYEVLGALGLLAAAAWQVHDMAAAGELCANYVWAC